MGFARVSFGEAVAAISGVLLIVFMFLPWFGYSADLGGMGANESVDASFWEVSSFLDILLFLVGVVAVTAAAARAAGAVAADMPAPPGAIVLAAGVIALAIVLFRLLSPPDGGIDELDVSRNVGVFLGLLAAAGVAGGGFAATNERGSGASPPAAA